jgi:CheY-like chemotaxis protein
MREILESLGFQVQVAYNASAAMTLIKSQPPDLIMLDIMMPDKDGLTFLREMRADSEIADIPTIVASAKGTEEVKRASIEAGANAFLEKPLTMDDIRSAAARFLDIAPQP